MSLRMIHIPRVSSTNLEASDRLNRKEISEPAIIYADYQEHGKGRGAHTWVSEPGLNLLMSWISFPAFLSVDRQFRLSKLVSVVIVRMLGRYGLVARIKWPNDILVDGRKIGGVLIEHSLIGSKIRWSIAGIGLNLNQDIFPPFDLQPTSYILETGKRIPVEVVLNDLAIHLESEYHSLESGMTDVLDSTYDALLYRMHTESEFAGGDQFFTGKIRGVNETGELLVERSGKIRGYGMHEIRLNP